VNLPKFFAELKRRNVYKVAVAYAIVGWLLVQVATQVFPFFEIPNWVVRLVVLLIIIGFPIALVIAWAFELTPEGLKRTEALGQKAEAIHLLEQAYDDRDGYDMAFIKTDPLLDPLRSDPRFEALVQKIFAPDRVKDEAHGGQP
jgi:hypothetical protein